MRKHYERNITLGKKYNTERLLYVGGKYNVMLIFHV